MVRQGHIGICGEMLVHFPRLWPLHHTKSLSKRAGTRRMLKLWKQMGTMLHFSQAKEIHHFPRTMKETDRDGEPSRYRLNIVPVISHHPT